MFNGPVLRIKEDILAEMVDNHLELKIVVVLRMSWCRRQSQHTF